MVSTFWITLVGLLSGVINGIISLFDENKLQLTLKWTDILKIINVLLTISIITYLVINRISESNEIAEIKTTISSFVKDPERNVRGATLSEITLHLRARGYDDTKYSKAITDLLKEGILQEEQPKPLYYIDKQTTYTHIGLIYR